MQENRKQKGTQELQQQQQPSQRQEKMNIMLFAAIWIIVIAAIVFALAPRGTPLQRCEHGIVASNDQQCIYDLALSSENGSLCANITSSSYSGSCYLTIAEETSNVILCGGVSDPNASAQCVEFVANATDSFSDCYSITGYGRSSCFETMALKDYNSSLCTKVTNSTNATICSSAISFGDAIRLKNESYCASVTQSQDVQVTTDVVGSSGTLSDDKVAANLTGYLTMLGLEYPGGSGAPYGARDFCYLSYAAQYGNESACASISNQTLSESCAYATQPVIAQSNATSGTASNTIVPVNYTLIESACEQGNPSNATPCSALATDIQALAQNNVSLCGTLATNYSYDCYADFADRFMNTSYCSYIKGNYTVYNACVSGVYYNATAAANGTATYPYP